MSEVIQYVNPAEQRARVLDTERTTAVRDAAEPDIGAIENILRALEGMQTQVAALTDLVVEQDRRIAQLEKAKSKIIQVRQ